MSRTFKAEGSVRLRCRCSSVKETKNFSNLLFLIPGEERGDYRLDKRGNCELDFNVGTTTAPGSVKHRETLRRRLIDLGAGAFTRGQDAINELEHIDGPFSDAELEQRDRAHQLTKCVVSLKLTCRFCGQTHLVGADQIDTVWRARTSGIKLEDFEFLPQTQGKSRFEVEGKKSRVELILDPDPLLRDVIIDGVKTGFSEEDLKFAEKMLNKYLTTD